MKRMTATSSGRAKCKNLVAPGGGSSSSRFGQYGWGGGGGREYMLRRARLIFLKNKINAESNGTNLLKSIIRPLKFINKTINCTSQASTFGGQ